MRIILNQLLIMTYKYSTIAQKDTITIFNQFQKTMFLKRSNQTTNDI